MRVEQVDFVTISTRDVKRAVEFYRDALGLEVLELGVLERAGAEHLGGPVVTPWGDRNVRVRAPDGMQLTLFEIP